MKYVNTKTGAILETKLKIIGGNWQEITSAGKPKKSASKKKEN